MAAPSVRVVDRQGVFRFYKFYKTRSDERGTSCVIAPPESQPREFHTDRRRERGSATENANTAKKGARGHVCQITGWIVPLSLSVRCEHCEGGRGRNEKCSSVPIGKFWGLKADSNQSGTGSMIHFERRKHSGTDEICNISCLPSPSNSALDLL